MISCRPAPYSLQTPEWLVFLRLVCAFAENGVSKGAAAASCVWTVLSDPLCRIAVMGGREDMPRSLGSVYGGAVTRFLGGFRGVCARTIQTPSEESYYNGVAVSRDGTTLLTSNRQAHAVDVYSVHTGEFVRTIGGPGTGPLQFNLPLQVWVSPDGFVFVAEWSNNRIQILEPQYEFHAFVGIDQLHAPHGVCANDQDVVVSEWFAHRVSVFDRADGALLCRFGKNGSGEGELFHPADVCFMSGHRHIAVADYQNARVSVWTLQGEFVRHVGVGTLTAAIGVACSDAGELIVADDIGLLIVVFSASGEMVWSSAASEFTSVTMHGCTILGRSAVDGTCIMFS